MKLISVGIIAGTHGIKGEVKVKSDSDFRNERFKKHQKLFVKRQGEMETIIIDSHRQHKQWDLITFNQIQDINLVLDYVGCELFVNREDLPPLSKHEYYFDDLIGLDACLEDGTIIGQVSDITNLPQGFLLVITKPDQKEALVPFVPEFVKQVDINKKRIIITPIEGLL